MKKVLIIGAGNIASGYDQPNSEWILTHAHAIKCNNMFSLVGFYDVDRVKAEDAAKKWNTIAIDDLEMIKDSVDVVCCAVPDNLHYDVMKELYNWNNLQVIICEKPITNKLCSARELSNLYLESDKEVIVNYSRRYIDEFIEVKEWIVNKAGKLTVGTCLYGKGIIHNCSHMINLLHFLFGRIEIDYIGRHFYDYNEDDPSVDFSVKAKEGKIYFHPIPCNNVTVFEFDLCFEKVRIKYDDTDGYIKYYVVEESDEGELNYCLRKTVSINRSNALVNLYTNVYNVLEKKEKPKANMEDAVEALQVCYQIKERVLTEKKNGSFSD